MMNLNYYKKKIRDKILNKKLVIGVIGLGYVGLPLSILFANQAPPKKLELFVYILA